MLCKVTHCAGRVLANTRPHQLRWDDREMGTAIYLMYKNAVRWLPLLVESPQKHRLFLQLFFMHDNCPCHRLRYYLVPTASDRKLGGVWEQGCWDDYQFSVDVYPPYTSTRCSQHTSSHATHTYLHIPPPPHTHTHTIPPSTPTYTPLSPSHTGLSGTSVSNVAA